MSLSSTPHTLFNRNERQCKNHCGACRLEVLEFTAMLWADLKAKGDDSQRTLLKGLPKACLGVQGLRVCGWWHGPGMLERSTSASNELCNRCSVPGPSLSWSPLSNHGILQKWFLAL
jgi:hypothetical protein